MVKVIYYQRCFSCLIFLFATLGCSSQTKTTDTIKVKGNYFDEEKFIVDDKRVIDNFHSYYEVKSKATNQYFVFYLDESQLNEEGNHLILDKLLIPKLESNQYIQTGSFEDKNNEKQLIVAIEKYNQKELPDPSIEIYDLWIFDKEKEKFIKKDEKKFHRIHEGYYLKKK